MIWYMLFLLISINNVKAKEILQNTIMSNPINSESSEFALLSGTDPDNELKQLVPLCRELKSHCDSIGNSDSNYKWKETEDVKDEDILRAMSLEDAIKYLTYLVQLAASPQLNVMDVIEKCRLLSNEIHLKVKEQCNDLNELESNDLKELANKAAQLIDKMEALKFAKSV
ncbi:hypothetical protein M896_121910 [Ordospora colligata OC4]|uniref:Secreted protein n=1 Tax=Ordospora colligata OC4 TaxID=1354746 RepID=A0A0B2UHZ5_9MICR|nr:uncharacterized protein M896_121910 [Ordospora colligata OC4]KHN68968.1 hypothetical protein M896_121910 [Ordospora colligata OC4]TBU14002.1 hypothetical protein CWI40_121910 [Ordospora colligata]TBU14191.1 hypothetical protein CWI41_121910 [Ordospora colligata]